MDLTTVEFAVSAAHVDQDGLHFTHVSIYVDGKYIRPAQINDKLLEAMQKKGIIHLDLNSLEEMQDKNPALKGLIDNLGLEKT